MRGAIQSVVVQGREWMPFGKDCFVMGSYNRRTKVCM